MKTKKAMSETIGYSGAARRARLCRLSFAFFLCLFSAGLRGARAQSVPAVLASTPAATVEQFYHPASMRDPLKASIMTGDEQGPKAKGALPEASTAAVVAAASVSKTTFSVYNLSLAGLMEDLHSKEAMLTDTVTGLFYTLKAGRLLDAKKKPVPGVSGVIKGKQVILMTDDKKIHQLTLHQKD